jgi:outer membrane protein TolC
MTERRPLRRRVIRPGLAALGGCLLAASAALAQSAPTAMPASAPRPAVPAPQPMPPPTSPIGTAPLPIGKGAAPLTLEQAEQLLVQHNLTLIAARRGIDLAWAQRLVNSSLPPPQVTVGNTYAQFNESNRNSFQGARFLSPSNNITAGISVLIERGGKRTLRTRVAEEQIGVAEAQVLDALRTQMFQLRQAFLGALLARANLEVALGNRASLDRTEALLRRQLKDGAIPEGDLLRFQASRLQYESDVTGNAQAYAAGIAAVAALLATDPGDFTPGAGQLAAMGITPPTPTVLGPVPVASPLLVEPYRRRRPGQPPAPSPAAAPTTVQTILSPVAFDVRGRFDSVPELGIGRDELAQGVATRPDVVAAARQASAAGQNRLLAEAARSRDVTLNTGWNRSRLSQNVPSGPGGPGDPAGQPTLHANDQFGVNLSIPIFTARITEGNVGIASAQLGQAEAQARATLLQARADYAVGWASYEQSLALLRLYTSGALNRAEEAYRSVEAAYLAGGRSLLDVMDALRTLNTTRLQSNQARYAYLLALAQLEQASGVSGIAPRL